MRRVYPPAAYKRVAQLMREHIDAGLYTPGEKLPTIAELTVLHGIKANAAYEALRLLCREGHAVARRGSGYYVTTRKKD